MPKFHCREYSLDRTRMVVTRSPIDEITYHQMTGTEGAFLTLYTSYSSPFSPSNFFRGMISFGPFSCVTMINCGATTNAVYSSLISSTISSGSISTHTTKARCRARAPSTKKKLHPCPFSTYRPHFHSPISEKHLVRDPRLHSPMLFLEVRFLLRRSWPGNTQDPSQAPELLPP